MILATAPRVVSPGEKVSLPITLFVQKENIRNIDLFAEGNELVSFTEKVKSITISGTGERDEEFTFTAGEKTGIANIKIRASGGGENAEFDISLNVRSPNPPETRSELKILSPGEKFERSFEPFGIAGSNMARIEVSLLPSVNLENRLGYLISYPHGCTEQITSAAFPQLFLSELSSGSTDNEATITENIRAAIDKIVSRQMNNGGITLWPGNYQPDNWVTSYAGHFMTEAERKGYRIPSDFKRKWLSYQKRNAQDWRYDTKFKGSANDQAYRLLTLALAGEPERGAMNRLRESPDIPRISKWLLAAAFATSGRPEASQDLLDLRNLETDDEYSYYYYGSKIRDKAVILYTLSVLRKEEQAMPLLRTVCDELNSDNWFSTQSIAWGLFSYLKFAEMFPGDKSDKARFSLTFNSSKAEEGVEARKIFVKDLNIKDGTNTIIAENTSSSPLYLNLVRKGIPLVSDKTEAEKGLSMKVSYYNTEMKPVDQKNLSQGTDFMMVTRITNTTFSDVDNIALTQMVPSGWEIRNTRLFEANYGVKENSYDYRDFRDDRVNTYFSLKQGETKTFVLILNAAYKGEFLQPSIWCEAMYTSDCYSRIPGTSVKVSAQ
jgi:alpha-2-macroglobulin